MVKMSGGYSQASFRYECICASVVSINSIWLHAGQNSVWFH